MQAAAGTALVHGLRRAMRDGYRKIPDPEPDILEDGDAPSLEGSFECRKIGEK